MAPKLLAPDTALFLDIDGTLVEFKDRPEDMRVPGALRETLAVLQQKLHGAVALVSGRELSDVDRLFAPLKLAAAGDHGAEARFAADSTAQIFAPPAARAALDAVVADVRSRLAASSRVRAEKKNFSLAFHYRGAEAEEARLRAIDCKNGSRQRRALFLSSLPQTGRQPFDRPQI